MTAGEFQARRIFGWVLILLGCLMIGLARWSGRHMTEWGSLAHGWYGYLDGVILLWAGWKLSNAKAGEF